jgi:hypothetical protein
VGFPAPVDVAGDQSRSMGASAPIFFAAAGHPFKALWFNGTRRIAVYWPNLYV